MGDHKEGDPGGGFFEQFQEGVGGCGVHLIGRIDDCHAAATIGGRQGEEGFHLTHFIDTDDGGQGIAFFVQAPAQQVKAAFGQLAHASCHRMVSGDVECGGGRRGEHAVIVGRSEKEAGNAPGQGGLADAFGASDEPGVVQAACVEGIKECRLRSVVAVKMRGFTRMGGALNAVRFGNIVRHGRRRGRRLRRCQARGHRR